jgi:hypothetical protein
LPAAGTPRAWQVWRRCHPRWFCRQALAVQELRRRADPTFGDDPDQWGKWIADVERRA